MRTPLRPIFVTILPFLVFASAAGQPYFEIAAKVEVRTYSLSPGSSTHSGHVFWLLCLTSTNKWRIDNDFTIGGEEKWLYDGTNILMSLRQTADLSEPLKAIARTNGIVFVPFEAAQSNVSINIYPSADGHPLGDPGVNVPWLAFCSGTYLKGPGRLVPLPIENLRNAPDAYGYTDKTQTFPDAFGLPRSLDLYTSKALFAASVTNKFFLGLKDPKAWAHAINGRPDGLLKFHYEVSNVTNFLGYHFPLSFKCVQYERDDSGDWALRYEHTGTVSTIRLASELGSIFDLNRRQLFVDWRFKHRTKAVNAITYVSTNTYVPPTNDPTLQKVLSQRIERAPLKPEIRKRRVRIALSALVLSTLLFPVTLLINKHRNG